VRRWSTLRPNVRRGRRTKGPEWPQGRPLDRGAQVPPHRHHARPDSLDKRDLAEWRRAREYNL
jgi:hypothetical protein